jgi:hypothetical protein
VDQAPGGGEDPQPQASGFPAAGRAGEGEGEHLRPGQEFAGQRDDLAPDLVGGEPAEGRLRRPVSLAQRILAAGPAAVAQFQVSELPAAGVCGGR